ncbi:MAG: assimilatory nitrite reductase large subunit precursor, partial [Nocardioides sp.]|nr:assimilatory nitrite reductase large subunit precursor [Nocardioides sp.]
MPEIGLPDEAVVCSCDNVTKATIVDHGAREEKPCADATCVTRCAGAGSTCGSCKGTVKRIVEDHSASVGKVVDRSLCVHLALTRQELFDVVAAHGYSSFDEVVGGHGTVRGCDVCKPTVASIPASQLNGHILETGRGTLQDTNDAYLANIQRNGTYSVMPRIADGEVTPEGLIVLGEVARDFGLYTKITGGQRIDLMRARMEELPAIWRRLVDAGFESGHAYGKSLRTVRSCVGSTSCRYGVQDSTSLATMLENRYRGLGSPRKLKGGVSGCARECAEARAKDFGVIATEKGWNLYVGGNGGARPVHAVLLAGDLDTETLVRRAGAGRGGAVAVFRTYDDRVFALSNYDPYSRASVLARGIVGSRAVEGGETTFVASPMHKQAFRPQHRAVPRRRGGAGPDVRRP